MPEKNPLNIATITYWWVFILAIFGGLVNYIQRVRMQRARVWTLTELIGEIVIAAFAGVITFYICVHFRFEAVLTAALVGMSGHMGGRAIQLFESYIERLVKHP